MPKRGAKRVTEGGQKSAPARRDGGQTVTKNETKQAAGEHILVSPRTTFGFSVDTWVNKEAADGSTIKKQVSTPLRLSGYITQGQVAGHAGERVENVRDTEVVGFKDGVRLEGCSLRVSQETALTVGFEDTGDSTALEKLLRYIRKMAVYGERIAFVSDDKAMANLMPQFRKNIENREEDEENARDYIALQAQAFS